MLEYQGVYQVVMQWGEDYGGNYDFSENADDNYIALKGGGQIYRYDKNTLVLHLPYNTLIASRNMKIKEPHKSFYKKLKKEIDIIDTFYFADCIEVHFNEQELETVIELLNPRYGLYTSRKSRPAKSLMNLPDYQVRRARLEKITHPRQRKKLEKMVDDISREIKMPKMLIWKKLYHNFKENNKTDISELANLANVKPINIIDSANLYKKVFKELDQIRKEGKSST